MAGYVLALPRTCCSISRMSSTNSANRLLRSPSRGSPAYHVPRHGSAPTSPLCTRTRLAPLGAALTGGEEQLRASFEEVTVEEVMNPHPVVLTADMPVKEAVRLFLEKDISGAPVVDNTGRLVGVISESDLIWKGVGTPQDHFIIPPFYIGLADLMVSWRDNTALEEEIHKILARTVGEAMNSHPVSVPPSMPMSDAATMMVKKKINRLPVLQDGKVVGVITRHDVLLGLVASNSPLL